MSILAKNVAIHGFGVFGDELSVNKVGVGAGDFGVNAKALEDLEANTGAAIDGDAVVILVR